MLFLTNFEFYVNTIILPFYIILLHSFVYLIDNNSSVFKLYKKECHVVCNLLTFSLLDIILQIFICITACG